MDLLLQTQILLGPFVAEIALGCAPAAIDGCVAYAQAHPNRSEQRQTAALACEAEQQLKQPTKYTARAVTALVLAHWTQVTQLTKGAEVPGSTVSMDRAAQARAEQEVEYRTSAYLAVVLPMSQLLSVALTKTAERVEQ